MRPCRRRCKEISGSQPTAWALSRPERCKRRFPPVRPSNRRILCRHQFARGAVQAAQIGFQGSTVGLSYRPMDNGPASISKPPAPTSRASSPPPSAAAAPSISTSIAHRQCRLERGRPGSRPRSRRRGHLSSSSIAIHAAHPLRRHPGRRRGPRYRPPASSSATPSTPPIRTSSLSSASASRSASSRTGSSAPSTSMASATSSAGTSTTAWPATAPHHCRRRRR